MTFSQPKSAPSGCKISELFYTFFKIGAFTFGGGYAMIALLEDELVSKKKWVDREEFLDIAAIAESTPGPIAVNSATYVGYKLRGVWGAAAATVAVVLPSFVIIYLISLFFDEFLELPFMDEAFSGIQIGVLWLIFSAGFNMLKGLEKSRFNLAVIAAVGIFAIAFSVLAVDFSSVFYILICGAAGVGVYLASRRKGGGE